tara:strand:+ start:3011 stop:3172 length:162 start_codon:yes stop_codon:yes gene_type:complete
MKVNPTKSVAYYIREIEVQAKKPLWQQIEELKEAGANLLVKLDNIERLLEEKK